MSRPGDPGILNRLALFVLVVLALAAAFSLAWVSRPAAGRPPHAAAAPRMMPLISAIRSCPAPGAGRVAVFAAPGQQAGGAAGLAAAPITAIGVAPGAAPPAGTAAVPAAPLATVALAGRLWLSRNGFAVVRAPRRARHPGKAPPAARPAPAAVIINASGPMAQGLDAEQTSYPLNGSAAAVTGVQCPEPGTDFWFLGPGAAAGTAVNLHLVNPDGQPAAADVEIFTDTGPLQGNADSGIEVPARGSVVQPVSKLVPGSKVVAMHVRTSVGRVVAAVQTGNVWWRAASAPAAQVVVPGLPGAGTGRKLYLIDPGGADAQVHVQAITPAGAYEPAGAGGIDVPAGSVVELGLPSLNGIPAALRLQSAIPVTAAVAADGTAFTAATGPLQQQGVIADNMSGGGYTTSVVLSAPGGAAQVHVTTAGAAGLAGPGQLVAIAAGHSVSVNVAAPHGARDGFAIVISPVAGSGPVYAGRVLASRTGGAMLLTPVVSDPSSVLLPPVTGSVTAAIP